MAETSFTTWDVSPLRCHWCCHVSGVGHSAMACSSFWLGLSGCCIAVGLVRVVTARLTGALNSPTGTGIHPGTEYLVLSVPELCKSSWTSAVDQIAPSALRPSSCFE